MRLVPLPYHTRGHIGANQIPTSNTSPGGYAEFQDFNLLYYSEDGSLTEESSTVRWCKALLGAAEAIGRDPCPGPKLEGWLKDAGFADVTHRKFKIPIGAWPKDPKLKEIGLFNITQILDGLEGFSLRLMCDVLGWQKDEVTVLLAGVRKELKSPHVHAQLDLYVSPFTVNAVFLNTLFCGAFVRGMRRLTRVLLQPRRLWEETRVKATVGGTLFLLIDNVICYMAGLRHLIASHLTYLRMSSMPHDLRFVQSRGGRLLCTRSTASHSVTLLQEGLAVMLSVAILDTPCSDVFLQYMPAVFQSASMRGIEAYTGAKRVIAPRMYR